MANRKRRAPKTVARKVKAAKAMAQGRTPEQAAAEAGYKDVKSVYRAQRDVLRLENMDDIATLRIGSMDRLDSYRRKLCRLAGIIDHEDPDRRQPPPRPQNTADRRVTTAEMESWAAECVASGFDGNGDPISSCESAAEQNGAIARLIAIEARRARLLGLDSPKIVAQVTAKSIRTMNSTELSVELSAHGMELPPGLIDALRANAKNPKVAVPPAVKRADTAG